MVQWWLSGPAKLAPEPSLIYIARSVADICCTVIGQPASKAGFWANFWSINLAGPGRVHQEILRDLAILLGFRDKTRNSHQDFSDSETRRDSIPRFLMRWEGPRGVNMAETSWLARSSEISWSWLECSAQSSRIIWNSEWSISLFLSLISLTTSSWVQGTFGPNEIVKISGFNV